MNDPVEVIRPPARFSRNDLIYLIGLFFLFIGMALEVSVGMALLVVGAVLTAVSIASSFFVTWLSVVRKEQA